MLIRKSSLAIKTKVSFAIRKKKGKSLTIRKFNLTIRKSSHANRIFSHSIKKKWALVLEKKLKKEKEKEKEKEESSN
jgi:hypothetical protein